MSSTKTSRVGSVVAFIASGIFIAVSVWLLFNRQAVMDQISIWTYEPSATIQTISDTADLTAKGEFTFYATQPEVVEQATFNEECPRQEAGSPILGCYTGEDRIYVYDITNEQLEGMEEVTAVHEMLHAAWYRMDETRRDEIGAALEEAYGKIQNDNITTRMEYYQRTEPGERLNELHSILGTEVASLGEPLESYYEEYFSRSEVLALHDQYSGVYQALYDRSDELYALMEELGQSITASTEAYSTAAAEYSADVADFNSRASTGGFSSMSAFYSERAALVSRSAELEASRQAINTNVNTYNEYYAEYQSIAEQIQVLNSSIDSFNEVDEAPPSV